MDDEPYCPLIYYVKPDRYSVLSIDANFLFNKTNSYNEIDDDIESILVQILIKANEEANKGKYELLHCFDCPFIYPQWRSSQFDSIYNLLKKRSKKLKNELIKRSFRIESWESDENKYKIHISWDKRIK